jgi:hypothetical protein
VRYPSSRARRRTGSSAWRRRRGAGVHRPPLRARRPGRRRAAGPARGRLAETAPSTCSSLDDLGERFEGAKFVCCRRPHHQTELWRAS